MNEHAVESMLLTMSMAIGFGPLLVVMARRLGLPAIVLLVLGGIGLGPQGVGWVDPNALGEGLRVVVELAIAVILFEGGLTLEIRGRQMAPKLIDRLLTVGVLTTWLLTALAIYVIFDFPPGYSLLSASLVIVTGPTVIGPLLKRLRLNERLHSILHWEGVLIDPIGVFIALFCFEWVNGYGGQMIVSNFILRFVAGLLFGILGGFFIYHLIRLRVAPDDMVNEMTLALSVLVFAVTEYVISKSGLLSVAVAGLILGWKRPVELRRIREFKAEITDLLIGMLFILLVARLETEQLREFGWKGAGLVAFVMIVVRPLNVLISASGLHLPWQEKAFLSWLAPRGIVAASMASLFAITLESTQAVGNPRFVETFTYSVIISTVLIQGLTAGPLAHILRVRRVRPTGWAIVGAHLFGRRVASFLSRVAEVPVVLLDTNPKAVAAAAADGLPAIECDATDSSIPLREDMQNIGNLLALTDNHELNIVLCAQWQMTLGRDHLYRWTPETGSNDPQTAGNVVWQALPKPSLLSAELMRGQAWMSQTHEPSSQADSTSIALMALIGKAVTMDPSPNLIEGSKARAVLFIEREANYLKNCIDESLALTLQAKEPRAMFEAMVELAARQNPDLPVDEIVADLDKRESDFPTVLGHGVAVPHIFHRSIAQRMCVIAQVPEGIDFQAPDQQPVTLVFLLLSPMNDADGHLATLGDISRLVGDPEVRERLMQADTPERLIQIIHEVQSTTA